MRDCSQGRFRQQVRFLRRQFLQDGGLPFSRVLSEEFVEQALSAIDFACLCPRPDFRRITTDKLGLSRHGVSFRLRPK